MATIYNINMKTVSAFCSYNEEQIEKIFEKLIKDFKDKDTKLGFECTEINVIKIK